MFRKTPEQSETRFRDGLYDEPRFGLVKLPDPIPQPNPQSVYCALFFFLSWQRPILRDWRA
ncbi:hypothetical protein BDZ94DRAFT_1276032 [Collybia nuda]|uniref:Uncharacterized protein n=1 Tax=Collybia nuda TaxID=64659 RepID=A0A9P5XT03_9AGAR|nr:hypothetical protein BDZ94DRAFT_1276032 [Collybia nuda]